MRVFDWWSTFQPSLKNIKNMKQNHLKGCNQSVVGCILWSVRGTVALWPAIGERGPVLLLRHKWFPSVLMLENAGTSPCRLSPSSVFPQAQHHATKPVYRRVFMWWIYCIHTRPVALSKAVWVPFGVHFLPLSVWMRQPPPPQALSKYMFQPDLCIQTVPILYTQ